MAHSIRTPFILVEDFLIGTESFLTLARANPGKPIVFSPFSHGLEISAFSAGEFLHSAGGTWAHPRAAAQEKASVRGGTSGIRVQYLRKSFAQILARLTSHGHPLIAVVESAFEAESARSAFALTELTADHLVVLSEDLRPGFDHKIFADHLKALTGAEDFFHTTTELDRIGFVPGEEFWASVIESAEPENEIPREENPVSYWSFAKHSVSPRVFRSASLGGSSRLTLEFAVPLLKTFAEFILDNTSQSKPTIFFAGPAIGRWLHEGPVQANLSEIQELPATQDLRAATFVTGYFGGLRRYLLPVENKVFALDDLTDRFDHDIGLQMRKRLFEKDPKLRPVWVHGDIDYLAKILVTVSSDLLMNYGERVWGEISSSFLETFNQPKPLAVVELRSDGEKAYLTNRLLAHLNLESKVELLAVAMAPSSRRLILDSKNWRVFLGGPFSENSEAVLSYWGCLLLSGFMPEPKLDQHGNSLEVERTSQVVFDSLIYFTQVFERELLRSKLYPVDALHQADALDAIRRFTLNAEAESAELVGEFFVDAVAEFVRVGPEVVLGRQDFSLMDLPFIPPLQKTSSSSIMNDSQWEEVDRLVVTVTKSEDISWLGKE